MRFESPFYLLLLLALPLIAWAPAWFAGGRKAGMRFSSVANAKRSGRTLRQRLSFLPMALRVLALLLVVVCLARPQKGLEQIREINQGVAIEMVLDRSGSMAEQMSIGTERMTRLDVAKQVFEDFVLGDKDELKGRPSDLIGMITFARYADTVAPLTLAHGAMPGFLDTVKLVGRNEREEDGTAIGDALALAAARLKKAEDVLEQQAERQDNKEYEIKSKIIILLTDGAQTAGKRAPIDAAKLAKEWGIKVYAIGIGGESVRTVQTLLGPRMVAGGNQIDERTLKTIAEETGGMYRTADDAEALVEIYKEIDELERSEIESIRFVDYKELFVPLALLALVLLLLEVILNATLFRRVP